MTDSKQKRNDTIVERALEGEKYGSIADDYGVTRQRVQQIARREGVPPRTASGPFSGQWNGGRSEAGAYIRIQRPEHHRADIYGYVAEHILIAERKIGRKIGREEHVHHINGNSKDNRPENLRVMSPGEHVRHHLLYWTRERLLAALRWVSLRVDRTATQNDLIENGIDHTHFYSRFPSLSEAQEQAGLTPNSRGHPPRGLPPGFREEYQHLSEFDSPTALADSIQRRL